MNRRVYRSMACISLLLSFASAVVAAETSSPQPQPPREDAVLYRKLAIPEALLVSQEGHTFGGDIRIGDLNGDRALRLCSLPVVQKPRWPCAPASNARRTFSAGQFLRRSLHHFPKGPDRQN